MVAAVNERNRLGIKSPGPDTPVILRVRFHFTPSRKRTDLDNLVKAVLDALMPQILYDDSQVFRIDAEKHYVADVPYTMVSLMWNEEKK